MSENADKVPQWAINAAEELDVTSGIISMHKSCSGPQLNITRTAAIIARHAPALPGGVREAIGKCFEDKVDAQGFLMLHPWVMTDRILSAIEPLLTAPKTLPPSPKNEVLQAAAKVHELKTWPPFFGKVLNGSKTFEVRKNDRNYMEGDTLHLREWDPSLEEYSGRETQRRVSYVMLGPAFGVEAGYCILGLSQPKTLPEGGAIKWPPQATGKHTEGVIGTGALWRERAIAAEKRMAYMVMPRSYYDDDWSPETEDMYNLVVKRHEAAIAATEPPSALSTPPASGGTQT